VGEAVLRHRRVRLGEGVGRHFEVCCGGFLM
jgi:hypothetical protein